jgi:D-xylose 1-dehydrogenase (NADP+, D-xylono-1,5-lactone-forming)
MRRPARRARGRLYTRAIIAGGRSRGGAGPAERPARPRLGRPGYTQRVSEHPFRWGILSAAGIARKRFVPGVRAGAEGVVVAVASRDEGRARAFAAELGITRAHASYDALLADPEVDGVYIGLPNGLHAAWTIAAARAGKHVLCEKPLARRAEDAARMVAACREAGVLLMEAFMWRHHPQHARVKALLAEGAVGEPSVFRGTFGWAMTPERRAAGDVRLRADLEGGALMDVGCYPLNAARFIFESEPTEVAALGRVDPELGVDTAFAAVLRFPGGRLAVIDASFDVSRTFRYEVGGPRGSIVAERAFQPADDPAPIRILRDGEDAVEAVPGADPYALEADHFARSARAGRLLAPAEDGLAQARVVEALYRSAETGRAVRLDEG